MTLRPTSYRCRMAADTPLSTDPTRPDDLPPTEALNSPIARRTLLVGATVGGAGLFIGGAAPAQASKHTDSATTRLTVLGTTDLHGNVFNWDYFRNATYSDRSGNQIGAAKCATLIKAVRAERGAASCITLDAGDTLQGTPLDYYYAKIQPISRKTIHPMALAMNAIGYDAAALGNHEFNYGVPLLRTFESQLDFPLLGANVRKNARSAPAFRPSMLKRVHVRGHKPVTVGILGLVTPGVAIWDKANMDAAKLHMTGIVEQARIEVPKLKAAGADVVIVSCHSGTTPGSSYGDALPWPENASTQLAEQVPDIDAILVGHAHVEIPQRYVTNTTTGRQVLLSEPLYWGMRVTVMDLNLTKVRGRWRVASATSTLLNANTVEEDAKVAALVRPAHDKVLTYVNGVIGTCKEAMSAATSRYQDSAAMDFINYVQATTVKAGIAGTAYADLPVLSIAAPFNRAAAIPSGDVTVRDVAGLYIYDNTLLGIVLTGAEITAYLEKSATYFKQITGTGPFAADAVTNAVTAAAPNGTPDYNYDIMGGLDARLTYDIDIAAAPGARIKNLAYNGAAVASGDRFVVAINNYRQSGGGGFPGVTTAPIAYNQLQEIRQLLIDWVSANGTIDPSVFSSTDWRLVSGNTAIEITS